MRYLERLLQINLATLAALGALLLGMGERSIGPPLLVAIAAPSAILLTDVAGWFRLSRRVANLLMLVAAAVSARDLFPTHSEFQAFGLAWFLIYLQIILLFQQKDARTYWLLITLSLLQVVVATLFSQGVWFGFLLLVYMLLGFSAMNLLLLYRQREHSPCHELSPQRIAPARSARAHETSIPKTKLPQPRLVGIPGGGILTAIGGDLFAGLGRMGLYTLALTLLIFFAVPRFEQFAWRGPIANPEHVVGFSDKVTLGELGQIIESSDAVMRVHFFDCYNDAPQPVHGEIYLQGALLMFYDHGAWRPGRPASDAGSQTLVRTSRLPGSGLVRQQIEIEGLDRDELFYVAPYIPIRTDPEIWVDLGNQRLTRPDYRRARRFSYNLGTTAIVNEVQQPLTPARRSDPTADALMMPKVQGADALPELVALADRWIAESRLPKEDTFRRARYLEGQFAVSGRFQYSLVGQLRDPRLDPIEDFLTKHPQGHCEYYATALTLMLRSQGIPARMVVGYKCDDWNALGSFYQVRQLHAHTWVEAYLEPSQLPSEYLHGGNYWHWRTLGGWLRLDPTVGSEAPAEQSRWTTPIRHTQDWLDFAWSNYVVELNYRRQQSSIYQPILKAARRILQQLTDPQRWRDLLNRLATLFHLGQLSGVRDWLTALAAATFAAVFLMGGGWLLWRFARRLWRRWTPAHAKSRRSRRAQVDFYRRFEKLLARRGLIRGATQTQQEFAAVAAAHLLNATGQQQLAQLPALVVDAFYRIRFGQEPLDTGQLQAVEHALAEITAVPKTVKAKS